MLANRSQLGGAVAEWLIASSLGECGWGARNDLTPSIPWVRLPPHPHIVPDYNSGGAVSITACLGFIISL